MPTQNHYYRTFFVSRLTAMFLVIYMAGSSMAAQNTDNETARRFAVDFFNAQMPEPGKKKSTLSSVDIDLTYQSPGEASTRLYVFQKQEDGFAIVAQSDNNFSIVGYSDKSSFHSEEIPPQLRALMNYYEDSLMFERQFPELQQGSSPVVAPLLDQYNINLNQYSHTEVGGCPTGCVATAVTQVMLYHAARLGKQVKGYGSYCYTDNKYGEICADFSGLTYSSGELLSYHVGISMDMQYCGDTYGSVPAKDFADGLENHFNYFVGAADNEDYFIKNELDNNRPLYTGFSGEPVGHAIVVDGYDSQGYYHLNFGWGGSCNGYYLMNSDRFFSPDGFFKFRTNLRGTRVISPTPIKVTAEDSLALVAIHNALGGAPATGWDLSKPVVKWPGVLIMNQRVIKLSISSRVPAATNQSIPDEIGNLTALRELYLYGCFNGNIPSSLSQLTELRELNIVNTEIYIEPTLYKGNLSGQLPSDIGNLTRLEWLSISNALEGSIPASIGNLTNLKLLWLDHNPVYFGKGKLSGPIPDEIGNLTKLQQFRISNQQIEGNIPATINAMTELREVDLSGNRLSGSLPALNLADLMYLKLNDNQIAEFDEGYSNCPALVHLELQNNQFKGELPGYFGNFSNLRSLNLSDNDIESLPEEIGNLIKLENISLNNNKLKMLPAGLGAISNLQHINARNNQIAYVPDNLGQSRRLITLDLSYNQITSIPDEIGNCPKLFELFLNSNLIKRIPESFGNLGDNANIYLQDNDIQGPIPARLMMAIENNRQVRLDSNRFVFNDIPVSEKLNFGIRHQKSVKLKKQVFKVQIGDTVTIDIRSVSNLSHASNEYFWLRYPEHTGVMTKDERFNGMDNSPEIQIIINQANLGDKYYCKVFNSSVPSFTFNYNGSEVLVPCLEYLNTDTIVFELASDVDIISEDFPGQFVTSLESLPDKTVSDGFVTLLAPENIKRGVVRWEASADGINWVEVSESMEDSGLKENIKNQGYRKLVLNPKTPAYYRCSILEADCDPIYSDKLKVNAPGTILFDEIINVTEEGRVISVDSIEVVVPVNFHEDDFRLTITKLDYPPETPGSVVPGTAYDVSVSFGDTFESPLLIRLKNIDRSKIKDEDIDKFQAVYFDDQNQVWKLFDHAHLSLKDSSIAFTTNHLTKISWWLYENAALGYTDYYERNNIRVYYKDGDTDFMKYGYAKKQSAQAWHVADIPLLVQDITEYLPRVMNKYKSLGLEVPAGMFSVYVKQMDDAGCVGLLGMINGYMMIGATMSCPVELRQVLAHEYMHYTQDYYISANPGNSFWMEAHATLADRVVWDDKDVPLCESEQLMQSGKSSKISIFNFLSNSWDYWDKSLVTNNLMGNIHYNYLAGTFLHYMRSERKETEKLEPAALLKETTYFGSWRSYLAGYTSKHLNSILGDEYEEFIKYIISGKNEKFTLLNTKGNPYSFIQDPKNKGVFTHPLMYRFKEGDPMIQKDEIEVTVPYMAAKVVLLENTNPDTMVLVNYRRNHNFDYDHMVYYGTYDHKKKEMTLMDISDSTEFNLLLDVSNEENSLVKFGNYGFLLFINKEYIGASALIDDFNASFEITAMPVINIESIGALDIHMGNSPMKHNFEEGTEYLSIGNPSAAYLAKVTGFDVQMINQTTSKRVLNDQAYQIQIQYTLIIDQGFIKGMPTMKDSTIYTQTIDHNLVTGIIKVTQHSEKFHILHPYITYVAGEFNKAEEKLVHGSYIDIHENRTAVYWLENLMTIVQPPDANTPWEEPYGRNIILFQTSNTSETTGVVKQIDGSVQIQRFNPSGELSSQTSSVYESSDFSSPDLTLRMIIYVVEE